ncbi:FAD-dependent oxidoreductase [Sphingosinicella sp. BN140058]|uniref:FAD-dependent oxidoreductase n=1 Tax=Sphingosinicella sp. BN140058 TaxID=1892855 RepID=UPI0010104492|nr:bifunctional TVP38/TMEM64 family protein/FAD-dependent oxidoreductase [Sphingosinicella sp. BN140058]QAY78328.1 pyridine nucleotide-disulfide oxidoreductase [Sphingosinicella sp. BN140058]
MKRYGRLIVLLLVVALAVAFFLSPLRDWLTLARLKDSREAIQALIAAQPLAAAAAFFLLYVAVTALSLPGAAILTLAAGALFGLWEGLFLASFASALGASLSFLGARYLLRDWVTRRFGARLRAIDEGIDQDGIFYLLTLRLNPAIPFFLINLGMGLTGMRLLTYWLVSQIGMLPGTFVYVNAGTQIGRIESSGDILSGGLLGAFVLLSLFPLLAKGIVGWLRKRRVYKGWTKPKRFDRNLIVIGAGAGGLVTSLIGATVRAKVTLIEAGEMGGDCLNTGCVPSKALIASAKVAHAARDGGRFGVHASDVRIDFRAVIERVHEAIRIIAPADSVERYSGLGVDVRQGHARIIDPWTVEIDGGERLTARAIVIAAGGTPFVPDLPGLAASGYLTSDTMWERLRGRDDVPRRILILGGGPIGTELAQAFARLGAQVVQIEHGPRLLSKEDPEVSTLVEDRLRADGVDIRTGCKAVRVEDKVLVAECGGAEVRLEFDELIVAVGRRARLTGYGLEELGVDIDARPLVNPWLETRFPNIYAVGDVTNTMQFTHLAAHHAWYAAVNALFGSVRRFKLDVSVLPWVTYTDPEVAHVGHNEQSAAEAGVAYETHRYDLSHLDRAVSDGARDGFVKLLVQPGKDRILGATIVGANAGETLAEIVLAMRHGLGLNKILATIHAYPTMAEANKYAAGEWKKAHKPEWALALAERWHRRRRG